MAMTLAPETEADVPHATLGQQWIDLTEAASSDLRLSFSASVWDKDLFLVVDIYAANNPVHPGGHVGWWKCPLREKKGDVIVRLEKDATRLRVLFDNQPAEEQWVNRQFTGIETDVLSLHVVLRQTLSEGIEFDDKLFIYNSTDALASSLQRREAVESPRGEPTSIPWYVWPTDCRVHVVAANVFENDAVGNFAFSVYRLLRGNGIPCQLYAGNFDPALRPTVRHVSDLLAVAEPTDLVFFNFSIHDPYMRQISMLPCKKILYFHNITPPRFFQIYDAEHAAHCMEAVDQLELLRDFDGLIANSASSGRVLQNLATHKRPSHDGKTVQEAAHARGPFEEASRLLEQAARIIEQQKESKLDVHVCPPFMNADRWLEIAAEPIALPPEKTLLLYVGRVAPHKRIEDLLALYRAYRKLDSDSALLIAGGASFDGYSGYLRYLMQNEFRELQPFIHFKESVSDGQLKTLYPAASVFVTMSEHEGFCVPLVESMVFDTPVFAYASEAVAETLGRAGRLFHAKNFSAIAADIHDVLHADWKKAKILAEQRRRLAEIVTNIDGGTIWSTIEEIFFHDRAAKTKSVGTKAA